MSGPAPEREALRVLHGPIEIAGQVGLSVRGLREIGCTARAAFPRHRFSYGLGPDLPVRGKHRWQKNLSMLGIALRSLGRYDVVHYHFAKSLAAHDLDVKAFRAAGAAVVAEFWGGDVRLPSVDVARNPFYDNPMEDNEAKNRGRLHRWADLTRGHVIIADHSLAAYVGDYFPHIHVVRQRIDSRRLEPVYPGPETTEPTVVHAPSRLAVKGTAHLRQAVERLLARGERFRYVELTGVPQAEVLSALSGADLVVDQLILGSHGVFAVEALALGKPVISYILPELVPTFPEGFPVINANPQTIETVLGDWLDRPDERHALGRRSRAYAERVHDCAAVARRLVEVYRELPRG